MLVSPHCNVRHVQYMVGDSQYPWLRFKGELELAVLVCWPAEKASERSTTENQQASGGICGVWHNRSSLMHSLHGDPVQTAIPLADQHFESSAQEIWGFGLWSRQVRHML